MVIIRNLEVEDYIHPFDKASMGELHQIPFLSKALDWLIKNAVERVVRIQYMGSNFRINQDSCPELHNLFLDVLKTLNIDPAMDVSLYTKWNYMVDSAVIGDKQPIVLLTTGAVDLLDEQQLRFALGIEAGHIKAHHLRYLLLCQFIGMLPYGDKLRVTLNYWARMSEYTADRAALLACQDIDAAIRLMMKTSGTPAKVFNQLEKEQFLQQVLEFEQQTTEEWKAKMMDKALMFMSPYPWIIRRAAQLLDWYENGNYRDIISKNQNN